MNVEEQQNDVGMWIIGNKHVSANAQKITRRCQRLIWLSSLPRILKGWRRHLEWSTLELNIRTVGLLSNLSQHLCEHECTPLAPQTCFSITYALCVHTFTKSACFIWTHSREVCRHISRHHGSATASCWHGSGANIGDVFSVRIGRLKPPRSLLFAPFD